MFGKMRKQKGTKGKRMVWVLTANSFHLTYMKTPQFPTWLASAVAVASYFEKIFLLKEKLWKLNFAIKKK